MGPLEECISSFWGGTSGPWQSREQKDGIPRPVFSESIFWSLDVFQTRSLLLRLKLGCVTVSCPNSALRLIDFQDLSDCYSPVGLRMQACQFQSQAIKEHPLCSGHQNWTPDVKTGAADLCWTFLLRCRHCELQ